MTTCLGLSNAYKPVPRGATVSGALHQDVGTVAAFLCSTTKFVLCAPCCLSRCLLCSYLYLTNCSIGISAVLFGLKVVLNHDSPGFTNVFGVTLPTKVTMLHMHEARCNGIVVQCHSKLSIVTGTPNRQAASCECLKIHACVAAALVMIGQCSAPNKSNQGCEPCLRWLSAVHGVGGAAAGICIQSTGKLHWPPGRHCCRLASCEGARPRCC